MTRHIPIAEIADWLHPAGSRCKAMALLRAYFDESGTHDASPITSIAGWVGPKEAWCELEQKRWLPTLEMFADKGVKTFHATDCVAQQREFARVDKPGINFVLTQLSNALGEQSPQLVPIGSAVCQDDWDAVVTDRVFLERFPKPFDLCFDDILRVLWEWGRAHAAGERIAPMFAQQEEYGPRMQKVGDAYGRENWYRDVLGPIGFGHPDQVVPLQAADFLSHQHNWDIEARRYGTLIGETKALLRATPRGIYGHWFDAPALELTVHRFRETGEIYSLDRP